MNRSVRMPSCSPPSSIVLGVLLAAAMLACDSAAFAQRDRDDREWDDPRPVMPSMLEEARDGADAFAGEAHRQAGLLREGSHLLGVRAEARRDEDSGAWIATLTLEAATGRPEMKHDVRLLPNAFLSELQRVIEVTPDQHITFEVTGEMFVYERRNYLLLRAPARVIGLQRTNGADDPAREDRAAEAEPEQHEAPRVPPGRAAEVMRDLERATGPLHRAQPARRAADAAGAPHRFREGALLMQRRGRVTRDAGGAWMFVFDADAQGLADPPLTLMPCLLLERIEGYARRAGPTAPILISGQVFVHEGRGYLMPSAFQLPRERTMVR